MTTSQLTSSEVAVVVLVRVDMVVDRIVIVLVITLVRRSVYFVPLVRRVRRLGIVVNVVMFIDESRSNDVEMIESQLMKLVVGCFFFVVTT